MRTEVMDGDIVPVAMGSNIQAQGVANLLSDIVRFFPSCLLYTSRASDFPRGAQVG